GGPRAGGGLGGGASGMGPIDELGALRNVLRPLVERNLVVYLTPEERRGAVLTHGFHDPRELERLRSRIAAEPIPTTVPEPPRQAVAAPAPSRHDERLTELESGLTAARDEIAALKQTVAGLQEELRQLKQSLGA